MNYEFIVTKDTIYPNLCTLNHHCHLFKIVLEVLLIVFPSCVGDSYHFLTEVSLFHMSLTPDRIQNLARIFNTLAQRAEYNVYGTVCLCSHYSHSIATVLLSLHSWNGFEITWYLCFISAGRMFTVWSVLFSHQCSTLSSTTTLKVLMVVYFLDRFISPQSYLCLCYYYSLLLEYVLLMADHTDTICRMGGSFNINYWGHVSQCHSLPNYLV